MRLHAQEGKVTEYPCYMAIARMQGEACARAVVHRHRSVQSLALRHLWHTPVVGLV